MSADVSLPNSPALSRPVPRPDTAPKVAESATHYAAQRPAKRAASIEAGAVHFDDWFDFDPLQRITAIKNGLPATLPGDIAARMGISKDKVYFTLGLPRATVERKVREAKPLSADEGAKVLGFARLVGQVQRMVQESGQPEGFDAALWLADWIDHPLPALAGMKPAQLMDTAEGQGLVANLLSRIQSGAYA